MKYANLDEQYNSAVMFVMAIGKFDSELLKKALQLKDEEVKHLIDKMINNKVISEIDEFGNYSPLKNYIHSEYLLQQELKADSEKTIRQSGEKKGKRINLLFFLLAVLIFVVTCFFALREPVSLIFIVGSFVVIGYFFAWVGQKAQLNAKLSNSEQLKTLRVCAIGFLLFSTVSNLGFLFWVDSKTPVFGEAYAERKDYQQLKDQLKKQKNTEEQAKFIRTYDARESVKSSLKDSSSAEFSGEKEGKDGAVCGYVNAKNSFGAYTGNTRYISVSRESVIDDGSQSFKELWETLCN